MRDGSVIEVELLNGFSVEIKQPIDYLDVIRLESVMKKIVRAADDPKVVMFPLHKRKPWRRPPKSTRKVAFTPRPAA